HDVDVALDEAGAADGGHAQSEWSGACFGSGVIACFSVASSCIRRLVNPSLSPRIFMKIPPPRPAMTDIAPATSPSVPIFAVSARWRICDSSRAIVSHRLSMKLDLAARL